MNEEDINFAAFEKIIKFFLSWIVLVPISIIICGKFINNCISIKKESDQLFCINLKILKIVARDEEVIFGFAVFIVCVFLFGCSFGDSIYSMIKEKYGIDPGQFNSIAIFSAFFSVLFSIVIFLIYCLSKHFVGFSTKKEMDKHTNLINSLSMKDKEQ